MTTYFKHIRYSSTPPKHFPNPHIYQKPEDVNPAFFIVRPNGGPIVPLIPVDELPIGLEFMGLSRSIEVTETIGMGNLGVRPNRIGCWKLVENEGLAKDGKLLQQPAVVVSGHSLSTPPSTPPTGNGYANTTPSLTVQSIPVSAPNVTQPAPQQADPTTPTRTLPPPPQKQTSTKPLPRSAPATSSAPPPPTMPAPIPIPIPIEAKPPIFTVPTGPGIIGPFEPQICRHWCAYGNCKWGINCRYLHIMPASRTGLQEVGLADWPAWWKNLVRAGARGSNMPMMCGSSAPRYPMQNFYAAGLNGLSVGGLGVGGVLRGFDVRAAEKEKEKERERERLGMLSVYPTGPRERFSRGLDIDYARSGGDAALARAWEEKLMSLSGGIGAGAMVRGAGGIQELDFRTLSGIGGGVQQGDNGKGKGKGKKGLVRPQYLQPVVRDGKVIGMGVADGSALTKGATAAASSGGGDVKGKEKEKVQTVSAVKPATVVTGQDPKVLAKAAAAALAKKKENEKAVTAGKKLDREVAKATRAWEDDVEDEADENKENVAPVIKEVGAGTVVGGGKLVDV